MPRKGSKKVKTGCHTCKLRKVKCDEAKPHCVRCTSTGRTCDGYAPKPRPHANLPVTTKTCFSFSGLLEGDARAIDFFQHVAGPTLSGQFDGYFWTHLVLQLSHREPAVRHAVVAVSSLYEQLQDAANLASPSLNNSFAIRQYNAAIRRLASIQDEAVVLVACVLFVCVEFLQGNRQLAIDHCRNGILIINAACVSSPWVRENLLPIFCRMSIFPFFFGSTISMFPPIACLDAPVPTSFTSFADAQFSLDVLLGRAVRFIRSGDEYRLEQVPIPASLLNEQEEINSSLRNWHQAFSHFNLGEPQPDTNLVNLFQMRYLVAKIWVGASLERSEMAYDKYINDFRSVVSLASRMTQAGAHTPLNHNRPKFIFEMGVLPLLYFVVIKCRSLEIRLASLSSLKELAIDREGLWDVDAMLSVGRRVVEIEHENLYDKSNSEGPVAGYNAMPPAEQRVWDSIIIPEQDIHEHRSTRIVTHRRVIFILSRTPGGFEMQEEWVTASHEHSNDRPIVGLNNGILEHAFSDWPGRISRQGDSMLAVRHSFYGANTCT